MKFLVVFTWERAKGNDLLRAEIAITSGMPSLSATVCESKFALVQFSMKKCWLGKLSGLRRKKPLAQIIHMMTPMTLGAISHMVAMDALVDVFQTKLGQRLGRDYEVKGAVISRKTIGKTLDWHDRDDGILKPKKVLAKLVLLQRVESALQQPRKV